MRFYNLPAYKHEKQILPLATSQIAHLSNQFNHVFALPISMPRFESIIFLSK